MSATASVPGKMAYTVVVHFDPEDDIYYATIPTLGIVTQGESYNEAFLMAEDAITGWLHVARKHGEPVPVEEDRPVQVRRLAIPA